MGGGGGGGRRGYTLPTRTHGLYRYKVRVPRDYLSKSIISMVKVATGTCRVD